jgi:hypothetical protein
MCRPTPALEPAGDVELAAVSLDDAAAPVPFVDRPRHGREEPLPGPTFEGPVTRVGAQQPQVASRFVGHPETVAAFLGPPEVARTSYLTRLVGLPL